MATKLTPEVARGLPRLTDPTRVGASNTRASTNHADVVATNGATGLSGNSSRLTASSMTPAPSVVTTRKSAWMPNIAAT